VTTHIEIQQVGANPTEVHTHRGDAVQQPVRNLFCPMYQACLDHAVRADWQDFTCAACQLKDRTPAPSATRYSRDRPKE
jgi:hypothetical protein